MVINVDGEEHDEELLLRQSKISKIEFCSPEAI